MGRRVFLQHNRRVSAIIREGDDKIVIFGVAGARNVREWAHDMADAKQGENRCAHTVGVT